MSRKAHGQIRRSQVITTWGPGALLDLPNYAVIVGGLDTWPKPGDLVEISESRLTRKLQIMTGVPAPRLYAPPVDSSDPRESRKGIGVWRFPEWFVVREDAGSRDRKRSRRLIHRKALDDRGRFDGLRVVPTRFVRACPKGHVDDLDWHGFVQDYADNRRRQLRLDERGTGGDLADLSVRCECGKSRKLHEATQLDLSPPPLGVCRGKRPWNENRKTERPFPGGPYALLHTLSHLLIQSLAMRCGYLASSIRERIYADAKAGRYGILRYTGSPDAEGTLGGLVQQARHIEAHLAHALRTGALCSNDPICAQHAPGESMEGRWLHGAACHGCALVAETSCEMRNDYLDRALVIPTLATADAAFFGETR